MKLELSPDELELIANKVADRLLPILREELQNPSQEPYLTVKQAAKFLGLSENSSTLYTLTANGDIPHYRICGGIRFKASELTKWAECNFKDPTIPTTCESIEDAISKRLNTKSKWKGGQS